MMDRRNGAANTGCVRWPTHLRNSGEGGMSVYALWPEGFSRAGDHNWEDPFYRCFSGLRIKASVCESPISNLGDAEDAALYGALCLGTSGGSWEWPDAGQDEWPGHWEAALSDLTDDGLAIVTALNALYGREAVLVTMLDT
jgi:hypothetical protein